jgi:hypothetical protein
MVRKTAAKKKEDSMIEASDIREMEAKNVLAKVD